MTDIVGSASPIVSRSLELVGLPPLMDLTSGEASVVIGLVDGPVDLGHPDLAGAPVLGGRDADGHRCRVASSAACVHGTLVAGMLAARRGAAAPAICPGCTLDVHPIFPEATADLVPTASQGQLAEAVYASIAAGAALVNVSAGLRMGLGGDRALVQVLDLAVQRGVIVVASAGNDAGVGGSALTRHPAVVPVAACDPGGRVLGYSNLSSSIGRRGLCAPGVPVASTCSGGGMAMIGGTSAAAPFVTGTLALLRSLFPRASAADTRSAVVGPRRTPRALVPPLLDARAAYRRLGGLRHRTEA